ncbi:MAG: NAD-glutamate dehydrogenase [Legionellaceae bacterium]|nr:NAD-glutamate dehydrogenase [Legionellaceae bacterium]
MTYIFEAGKERLIDDVIKCVKREMPKKKAELCSEFIRQFYNTVGLEDLQCWSINDLCHAGIHFWSTIQTRPYDAPVINLYKPCSERDGWKSSYTVLEVVADDAPFLVDSIRMTVNRLGFASHLIMYIGGMRVERGKDRKVSGIYPLRGEARPDVILEAAILMEINQDVDETSLHELKTQLEHVLKDNKAVVDDWSLMREKVQESIQELESAPASLDAFEVEETQLFLKWIEDHHFTFLGIRDYELSQIKGDLKLKALPNTGLGVLRESLHPSIERNISNMTPEARESTLSSRILVMSKTNTLASVHRDAYTDYIGIKRFNAQGDVIGERRILGLYTSAAYNTNPKHIPFLRHKVTQVMQNSLMSPRSHAGKVLLNILETLPRDDLIQGSEDELLQMSLGIFHMQERRRIRLFGRMDVYRRFASCLLYIPRERFNTDLRKVMQGVLSETFQTDAITFSTYFSESVLARIHFIIRLNPNDTKDYDFKALEAKMIEVGRSWTDDLQHFLLNDLEEEKANALFLRYKDAFPLTYINNFSPKTALLDLQQVESLTDSNPLSMRFYQSEDDAVERFRLKIYQHDFTLVLSDVLPILEKLGMRAISERPYRLNLSDKGVVWVNEFVMQYTRACQFDVEVLQSCFQEAFKRIWFEDAESDGFNELVLAAGMGWRQIVMLRTYAKYFKQIGYAFSQDYIESALVRNAEITRKIVQLFEARFRPDPIAQRDKKMQVIKKAIEADLERVTKLDEDKILRQFVHTIMNTLRTNYYQQDGDGKLKNYVAIKLNSRAIPGMPKPYPQYEIFVYSPTFEGVHLRCSKVARGGLRWSDRHEDFRTEVLGLMKAQQVKNAVIVPSGAKGGFVAKRLLVDASREAIQAEGIACYKQFIRALLDITDNYDKASQVIKPNAVICHDEDDPYLVVAADKGTATFSDIANSISNEYGFWLGDAFASGGSIGYDHKKMGITARGAWESVKRHFYEVGMNIMTTDFTVVGVGDMAGDVFGNGMLLSKHIKLVGAFNHMHIFIDPLPNAAESFKERERLFNLPRSSWDDYNKKLISKGGGVFSRTAKSISVSKEMKRLFGIEHNTIEPNELIRVMLQAKVDLLWSGGVGTFVKATTESSFEVGDRTNDAIRIDATALRCRVVGEGGNLGFTQLGRIEYALHGGLIYTDFIDNSAGVNCSDKEVNIKILLNRLVAANKLTVPKRNELLASMTDEVAHLVLRDNILQTQAISLLVYLSVGAFDLHTRYLNALEDSGRLDRTLEFIPDEKVLNERKLSGKGLASPEISVVLCYSKIQLKEAILDSNVPEEPCLMPYLLKSFPEPLQKRFKSAIQEHPLRREIIATKLSNIIVNEMGFSFVFRLQNETGAPASAVVRAYMIARNIFNMCSIWQEIENLSASIKAQHQTEVIISCVRLLRRTTRWFLRCKRMHLEMDETINRYAKSLEMLKKSLPASLGEEGQVAYIKQAEYYRSLGVPEAMAYEITSNGALFFAMDIIEISHEQNISVDHVGKMYFEVGAFLDLAWVRKHLIEHPVENQWEALSREALRDDLDWQQRELTAAILKLEAQKKAHLQNLEAWSTQHESLITRWHQIVAELRSSTTLNYTMFFVAIRELVDLTQTTVQRSSGEQACSTRK